MVAVLMLHLYMKNKSHFKNGVYYIFFILPSYDLKRNFSKVAHQQIHDLFELNA